MTTIFKARVQINWGKRKEIMSANTPETLQKLLSYHNNKPKGQGFCRVKVLEAA